MCVRKKETFSLLTYDSSTYHALVFIFPNAYASTFLLLLTFPTNPHDYKAPHTLSSFILCSYPAFPRCTFLHACAFPHTLSTFWFRPPRLLGVSQLRPWGSVWQEPPQSRRRRSGRAWGGRKELEFPLFLNEGVESARDSAFEATKEALALQVGCPPPTFLWLGKERGTWLQPLLRKASKKRSRTS